MAPPAGQGPSAPHSPRLTSLMHPADHESRREKAHSFGGCEGSIKSDALQEIVDAFPELREMLEEHGNPENAPDQWKTLLEIKADVERDLCIFEGSLRFLAEQRAATSASAQCTVCARPFTSAAEVQTCRTELEAKIQATELARTDANVVRRFALCKTALDAVTTPAASPPASPLASPLSGSNFGSSGALASLMETDADDSVASSSGSSSCVMPSPTHASSSPQQEQQQEQLQQQLLRDHDELDEEAGLNLDMMCFRVAFNMRTGALTELRNQKAENLQDQRCFGCLRELGGLDLAEYLRAVDRRAYVMSEQLHHGQQ